MFNNTLINLTLFNNILTKWSDVEGKNIILSFSGGLDSSTLFYNLVKKTKESIIKPIFFNYNQRHLKQEKKSAKIINSMFSTKKLTEVKIDLSFLGNSSLINKKIMVNNGNIDSLPNSFVAGRNLLFLTYLASIGYNQNNKEIIIAIANHYDDFNSYPDCKLKTLQYLQKTLSLGLDKKVKIFAPFTNLTKKDIVKLSTTAIIDNSWSCYEGLEEPCNKCKSCILRNDALRGQHE